MRNFFINKSAKAITLFLLIVCCGFALCACTTPRNLYDRDGGVFVAREKIQIKLYNPDGQLTTTYEARFSGELVDSLPEGEGLLSVKAIADEDTDVDSESTESHDSPAAESDTSSQSEGSKNGSESSEEASDNTDSDQVSEVATPDQQSKVGWSYKGMFVKGHMEGEGTLAFKDGSIQMGTFSKDQLVSGSCQWKNGDVYEGQLSNGTYNGKGTYTFKNGDVYEGDFVNGLFSGEGTYTFASGASYVGSWLNGLYHGSGVYTTSNGKIYDGTFENGTFKG